jgi:hypothetical protein
VEEKQEVQRLSLDDFLSDDKVAGILGDHFARLAPQVNGGTFMACHKAIFEATGIWIEELVPVFQRLDAALATRDVRPAQVR